MVSSLCLPDDAMALRTGQPSAAWQRRAARMSFHGDKSEEHVPMLRKEVKDCF
jgi:hypothetical protein